MQFVIFPVRKPRGCWEAPVAQRDGWEAFDKSDASDLEQDSVFFWGGDIWKMWKETYGKCGTSMNIYKHWIGLREIFQETQLMRKKLQYDVL